MTRGVAPRTNLPPQGLPPTVLILPVPYSYAAPADRLMQAVTVPDSRWRNCDMKTTSLMATVLAKLAGQRGKADEVIFVGEGGALREGGSCNLFVRRHDRLETHPLDGHVLPGVTRGLLLQLAARSGLEVIERAPELRELDEWQEAFLCGTLTGVQPLVALDGRQVADGGAGEWTRQLARDLAGYERRLIAESRA